MLTLWLAMRFSLVIDLDLAIVINQTVVVIWQPFMKGHPINLFLRRASRLVSNRGDRVKFELLEPS